MSFENMKKLEKIVENKVLPSHIKVTARTMKGMVEGKNFDNAAKEAIKETIEESFAYRAGKRAANGLKRIVRDGESISKVAKEEFEVLARTEISRKAELYDIEPGFSRFVTRLSTSNFAIYRVLDKVINEGEDGWKVIKQEYKEAIFEDTPVVSSIYGAGREDGKFKGKKEGYVEASKKYEEKFLEQTRMFINQNEVHKQQEEEYNKLLDEYEILIDELERKVDKTEIDNKNLLALLETERKLRKIQS